MPLPPRYAFIKFLDDQKKEIVPINDIENFSPSNVHDFDHKKKYSSFYMNEKKEKEGPYACQIIILAGKLN